MTRRHVRSLAAVLALVAAGALAGLGGCAAKPPRTPAAEGVDSGQPPAEARGEHVLVMLPDAAPPHFRPGAGGGYLDTARRARVLGVAQALVREHGGAILEAWPMPALGLHCVLVAVPAGTTAERFADRVGHDARVEWAQQVSEYRTLGRNDPYYPLQTPARTLDLSDMHGVTTGRGVRIAVIDSGVDEAHPDLAGQMAPTQDFIGGGSRAEMHGTAVAGIIGARADNGVGTVGVAPDARLLPLRACRQRRPDAQEAACDTFAVAKAFQRAFTADARVVNLSLTGPPDRLLGALIDRFAARGGVVVAAADRAAADGGFPASHPRVIAVASQHFPGASQRLLKAPGHEVLTTLPGGRWAYVSGDSFAAAHVSGVAALLLERAPSLDATRLSAALAARGPDGAAAAAAIDPCAALAQVDPRTRCSSRTDATAVARRAAPP
jgi:subtilisin family serine protease